MRNWNFLPFKKRVSASMRATHPDNTELSEKKMALIITQGVLSAFFTHKGHEFNFVSVREWDADRVNKALQDSKKILGALSSNKMPIRFMQLFLTATTHLNKFSNE